MPSKAFGSSLARYAHLIRPGGGLKGELYDLRADVELAFMYLEGSNPLATANLYFDSVAVAQGAAVPGFNAIRPVLEAMMYEGIQCPGTTARLPCNEGSGATCASATAGTSGTLVASTWTAAGTIAWPSDY